MMKRQTIVRLVTDGLMTGCLLLSMANRLTGNAVHEVVGVLIFAFFILHQVLNRRWYTALFKGRYNGRRTVNTLVIVLLISAFVLLTGSSVMISRTLFTFFDVDGGLTLRQIHTTTAYWFLVLSAVHLGIHFPRLVKMTATVIPVFRTIKLHAYLKRMLALVIVITGIHGAFDRNLGAKLFMTYAFDFWDFDQSVAGFFIRNLSIMGLYAVAAHYALLVFCYLKKENLRILSKQSHESCFDDSKTRKQQ